MNVSMAESVKSQLFGMENAFSAVTDPATNVRESR